LGAAGNGVWHPAVGKPPKEVSGPRPSAAAQADPADIQLAQRGAGR